MDMELSAFVVLVAVFIEDGYVYIYNYIHICEYIYMYIYICIYIYFFFSYMYVYPAHNQKNRYTVYISSRMTVVRVATDEACSFLTFDQLLNSWPCS